MLALDHRKSLKKLINPSQPETITDEEIVFWKEKIIKALYRLSSGILLDPEYGLAAYRSVAAKEQQKRLSPFLLSLEKSGYQEKGNERLTELEYSAEELKEKGASGVKLLIYFNSQASTATAQIELAKKALAEARQQRLPLFLEIVHYGPGADVPTTIKAFQNQGVTPEVFKLEFPGDAKKCYQVTQLLRGTPWILLTRGVSFQKFENQLKTAAANGASGFLAGRALWQEVFSLPPEDQADFLKQTLPQRFERLSQVFEKPVTLND